MKKGRNRAGSLCLLLGSLLILVSLGLFLHNIHMGQKAGKASNQAVEQLMGEIQNNRERSAEPEIPGETGDPAEETGETRPTEPIPMLVLDGKEYLGILEIPDLELKLPVQTPWSYPKLQQTPCLYSGSLEEGQMFIAAHNYPKHFGNLGTLKPGAKILFTDGNGREYTYQMEEQVVIDGNDPDTMLNTDYALSLFTCSFGGTKRLTIRCNLQENP